MLSVLNTNTRAIALYTRMGWQLDGSRLILTGKSMGNGNSSLFTATSTIDSLSRNTLILNTDGTREVYTRMADADGR